MAARRTSFRGQMNMDDQRGRRASLLMADSDIEKAQLQLEIGDIADDVTTPFTSKFAPSDMRQLALVAHNHMKPAMKQFIETYSEVLKKFRITGTNTTMRMCKSCWGEDNPEIEYGLACSSGPLGGDAQIAALMCMEDLGALIFFVDPLSAHPHQADIDSLLRLCNVSNVIVCPNPTSAMSMMHTLKGALEKGSRGMIPSFFQTLESPAVAEYKLQQELALAAAVNAGQRPTLMPGISMHRGESFEEPGVPFHPDLVDVGEEGETGTGHENESCSEDDNEEGEDVPNKMDEMQFGLSELGLEKEKSSTRLVSVSSLYGIPQPKTTGKKRGMMKKLGKQISHRFIGH